MTETDNRDRLVIKPAPVPLSPDAVRRARTPMPSPATVALGGALVALLAIATWTVFVLPDHIDDTDTVAVDAPGQSGETRDEAGGGGAVPSDYVPPFRRTELAKAEAQAKETLAEVVELQRLLEGEMQVEDWAADQFAAVLDLAIKADRLFLETNYEEAQAGYEAAATRLGDLREEGLARFDDAMARGAAALDALATEDATQAFADALTIQPNDAGARTGADRAALQPRVLELVRAAERARLRGNLDRAEELLQQARSLDPLTAGVDTKLREVRAASAEQAYRETLSIAFAALARGDFDGAEASFNRVLAARPDDAGALAGLQQTGQRRTLSRIDALRVQSETQENASDWEAALATFDAALAIDPSLQFARDGRARILEWVEMLRAIDAILDDPAALSEDARFEDANALVVDARAQIGAGESFETKTQALAQLLSRAATPVELVLLSDNATDVVIHSVAALGSFKRRALHLRPGRYVIVGSRDGCRDVRMEILLEAGLPPVTVRCEERI